MMLTRSGSRVSAGVRWRGSGPRQRGGCADAGPGRASAGGALARLEARWRGGRAGAAQTRAGAGGALAVARSATALPVCI